MKAFKIGCIDHEGTLLDSRLVIAETFDDATTLALAHFREEWRGVKVELSFVEPLKDQVLIVPALGAAAKG